MGKLSDILSSNGDGDDIRDLWNDAEVADEFGTLPPDEYIARIVSGELATSRKNSTPHFKLTFKVLEGDYRDRQFWYDIWLTEAALPMAKRDLAKLGITELEQLEQPLPKGIRSRVQLALRRDDDGNEFNRVVRFEAIGIDEPEPDDFAPKDGEAVKPSDAEKSADSDLRREPPF